MEISSTEVVELRRMANQLLDLADRIEGVPVQVPEETAAVVRSKLAQGLCLACNQPLPPGAKVKRGQDETCYNTTRGRIRRGDARERELILAGKLTAEQKQPGRPAKQDLLQEAKAVISTIESKTARNGEQSQSHSG